jgi:NAD(P) transhydrogenase
MALHCTVRTMPVKTQYDFIVIGSGPSGRRAAIQAAKLGKSVLVVEGRRRVGRFGPHRHHSVQTLRETALNLSGWRERGFMAAPIA